MDYPVTTEPLLPFPPAPGRYRIDSLCGRGGTGSVYRAWDHDLSRWVALKFLRDDRPEHRARMMREARAQARIDHPNVCRIFDVSEEQDRLYIAMQWIEGDRLDVVAPVLTLEEKIGVMRDVADGIHAAHVEGIIHRDLTPANIIVTRRGDGSLQPFVVDFGLARVIDDPGVTATGEVVGTPQYLAPEQAWGATADRRSDVYSLGGTLYHLLCGAHPFSGDSAAEVLMHVIARPPRPLSSINKSIPRDLSIIVQKCMEKEPTRRYDSARALRDDLTRWLSGEPIAARSPGAAYRAYAFLRRNRPIAVAVTIATLVTGIIAGGAILTLREERAEREMTMRLEQQVRYIERLVEHDRALPLHDTRPARLRAQQEIARLAANEEARKRFAGPFAYAAGRARLATDDGPNARRELERAWDAGMRTPAVGFHLGVALVSEYARSLAAAERIAQDELRKIRVGELRARYQAAALGPLGAARGYQEQPAALIEARIAFLGGNDERVIALSRNVLARFPWNNEARLLEADAMMRKGRSLRVSGRFREAGTAFAQAGKIYEQGLLTSPSDIRLLDGLCQGGLSRLQLAGDVGENMEPWFESAHDACQRALVAHPEHVPSLTALSSAWTRIAFVRSAASNDDSSQSKGIEIIERALKIAPDDPSVLIQAGAAYYWMPLKYAPTVTGFMRRAVAADPASTEARHGLGRALLRMNDFYVQIGADPGEVLEEAVREHREVIRRAPSYLPAYQNLGFTLNHLASHALRAGKSPEPYYRQMIELLEPKIKTHPEVAALRHINAIAWSGLMQWRIDRGEPASHEMERAIAMCDDAIRINPTHFNSRASRAALMIVKARMMADVAARNVALDAAHADLEQLEKTGYPHPTRADWWLEKAKGERDPKTALSFVNKAGPILDEFLERFPPQEPWVAIARGKVERVRCLVSPPDCRARLAEKHFADAVALNPHLRMDVARARNE